MFVSNSDNLGATLDLRLLTYFAESGKSFLMEVAERTESDKKVRVNTFCFKIAAVVGLQGSP